MRPRDQLEIRLSSMDEDEDHRDVADLSAAERLGFMWQLTKDAWAFKGETERAESRLQRHVVRLERRAR